MDNWIQKLKIRLPAFIMLAATLIFWAIYDRYELSGPILLQSPTLAGAARLQGDCTGTNGHFVFNVPAAGKSAIVHFNLADAPNYKRIRVQGRMKVEDVVTGADSWRGARFLLSQYDKDRKWISVEHEVAAGDGTHTWKSYNKVFEVDPSTVEIRLVLKQTGYSGIAEFDQIVVEPVRLRTSYTWWKIVFSGLWIIMGALYFRICRLHCRKLRFFILFNVIAILFGTMMPEGWIQDLTIQVKKQLFIAMEKSKPAKPTPLTTTQNSIQKKDTVVTTENVRNKITAEDLIDQFRAKVGTVHILGHFTLFASLCFLVCLSATLEQQPRSYYLKVVLDLLLFGAVTESLQNLTLDRTPAISDWLTDFKGMMTGFVLFLIVKSVLWLIVWRAKNGPEQVV